MRVGPRLRAAALTAVLVPLGYSLIVVTNARRETPARVREARARIVETVELERVPRERIEMLIRVQDPRFREHRGTDFGGGRITTLTQSLVKDLYFEEFKPGLAKIKQSLIARFVVDPLLSKKEQLFLFLNRVYLGQVDGVEIRGFGAAAKAYFGKSFLRLSEGEYLSLLAMLEAPNRFSVRHRPVENAERVRELMSRLKPVR